MFLLLALSAWKVSLSFGFCVPIKHSTLYLLDEQIVPGTIEVVVVVELGRMNLSGVKRVVKACNF